MSQEVIEILLVEDNPNDVELTLRALKKHNLANKPLPGFQSLFQLSPELCTEVGIVGCHARDIFEQVTVEVVQIDVARFVKMGTCRFVPARSDRIEHCAPILDLRQPQKKT